MDFCNVCELLSHVAFSRYYTGFSPVFSRYNGENGLVGGMKVWECKAKEGLEDYLKITRTCQRVTSQCQVGFSLLATSSIFSFPQRLLFSWGPGSGGEELAEGSGIKVERGHYLLLQVRYTLGEDESSKNVSTGGVQPWDGVPHGRQRPGLALPPERRADAGGEQHSTILYFFVSGMGNMMINTEIQI